MSILLSQLSQLEWRQPVLILLALVPLFLWLILRGLQQHKQSQFVDSALLPWIRVNEGKTWLQRIFSRNMAYVLAWCLLALALAGPRIADDSQHSPQATMIDIMLVVDLSVSMQATDIAPSRLRRAVLEVYEFLNLSKARRMGVIVYAARPHVFVPLTSDQHALKFYLQDIDSLVLPTEGSGAGAALLLAQKTLQVSLSSSKQAVIWLTDGDIAGAEKEKLEMAIQQLNKNKMSISIMGLATEEGAAIPNKQGGWLEFEGQGVVSKLDTDLLQRLADEGGGQFVKVSDSVSDWSVIDRQLLEGLPSVESESVEQWQEVYGIFLFPAILLLLMALMPFSVTLFKKSLVVILLLSLGFFEGVLLKPAYANDHDHYHYQHNLTLAITAYQSEQYTQSKRYFIQAILLANNHQQRGLALHNLGNTLFQMGDYKNAEAVFTDALRYRPEQEETINNQHLTKALNAVLAKRLTEAREREGAYITGSELLDLPDQLAFMIPSKAKNKTQSVLPKLPVEQWRSLLGKGLKHLQRLGAGGENKAEQQRHQENIVHAKILLMNVEAKSSNALWKRLFEIEEGFPAKLKQPEKIPGVRPW